MLIFTYSCFVKCFNCTCHFERWTTINNTHKEPSVSSLTLLSMVFKGSPSPPPPIYHWPRPHQPHADGTEHMGSQVGLSNNVLWNGFLTLARGTRSPSRHSHTDTTEVHRKKSISFCNRYDALKTVKHTSRKQCLWLPHFTVKETEAQPLSGGAGAEVKEV